MIGYPLREAFAALALELEVPGLVATNRREFWDRSRKCTRLLPGAAHVLRQLAGHVSVGIVSSRSRQGILNLLDYFNLADSVAVVVAAHDLERPTPDPEPILAALSSRRLRVGGVAMVGDTPLDTTAARAARVLAVGEQPGFMTRTSSARLVLIWPWVTSLYWGRVLA